MKLIVIIVCILFYAHSSICMNDRKLFLITQDRLFTAIKQGADREVDKIVQLHPAIINERRAGSRDGYTPLSCAAMYDRVDICQRLLQLHANPNLGDYNDNLTPLHRTHDARIVEMLLKAGADPNAKTKGGIDLLCWSALSCSITKVKLLLQYGARVDLSLLEAYAKGPIGLEREIEKLLREAYGRQLREEEEGNRKYDCCICMESFSSISDTPCPNKHNAELLCYGCYLAIKIKGNCCPFCRENLVDYVD